jgi:hypothetical protein
MMAAHHAMVCTLALWPSGWLVIAACAICEGPGSDQHPLSKCCLPCDDVAGDCGEPQCVQPAAHASPERRVVHPAAHAARLHARGVRCTGAACPGGHPRLRAVYRHHRRSVSGHVTRWLHPPLCVLLMGRSAGALKRSRSTCCAASSLPYCRVAGSLQGSAGRQTRNMPARLT